MYNDELIRRLQIHHSDASSVHTRGKAIYYLGIWQERYQLSTEEKKSKVKAKLKELQDECERALCSHDWSKVGKLLKGLW